MKTPSERKAGKLERIDKLLEVLRSEQPPVADEEQEQRFAPPKRKTGKRERVRKMLKVLRPEEPKPVVNEELIMLLGMKQEKK